VVSSEAASSVPGRSEVAATWPITCGSWRPGMTWTPGPAATVVVATSADVMTAPAGTAVVTSTTGTW
jgi:hypothetical protein